MPDYLHICAFILLTYNSIKFKGQGEGIGSRNLDSQLKLDLMTEPVTSKNFYECRPSATCKSAATFDNNF